jgi:hypothetical protein
LEAATKATNEELTKVQKEFKITKEALTKVQEELKTTNGEFTKVQKEFKIVNDELTDLKKTVSTVSCDKGCTRDGCPLDHGGLTNRQAEALKKKEKVERDLQKARAETASKQRTKRLVIENEAREKRRENLRRQMKKEDDEEKKSAEAEEKYTIAQATASEDPPEEGAKDVRDPTKRNESACPNPKPEERTLTGAEEPGTGEGNGPTDEDDKRAQLLAEKLVDDDDKKEASSRSKRSNKKAKKDKRDKDPKGKTAPKPPVPALPPAITAAKGKPTSQSSNVLTILDGTL